MDITLNATSVAPEGSRRRAVAIVAVACAVLIVTNGFILSGLTVFDSRILAELHISNAALRLRDTITIGTLGLSVSIVGHLLDRFAVRPILIGGLLLMAGAFVGYHWVSALWQIYALHVLLGLTQATSGVVGCVYLVSRWTYRHRGFAHGILIAGASHGNPIVPAVNSAVLAYLPWRSAILLGAVIAMLLIPLILIVVKEPRRVELGSHGGPDGMAKQPLAPILRTRSFVLLGLIAATTVFCVLALATNLALFAAGAAGAAAGSGPLLLFALFGAAVAAQLAAGIATYRVPAATIHATAVVVMLIGALSLAAAPSAYALASVTLFGLGWGANSTMLQVRPSILFTGPSLGRILSLLAVAETLGGGMGPAFAGYVSDRSGSFIGAFWLIAALMLVPALASLALYDGRRFTARERPLTPSISERR